VNQQELFPVIKPCNKPRLLTVVYACTDTPGVDVPYLRLRGRWLEDAGFVIGRHVRIEVDEGRLMIEPVD
jgi:toxic protein SymE